MVVVFLVSGGVKGWDCLTDLFEHPEEHLPAEVAECGSLVGVNGQAVGSDLHVLVPQWLSIEDNLHHHALLDVRHGVDGLK